MIPSRRVYWLLLMGTGMGLGLALVGSQILTDGADSLRLAIGLTLAWDAVILLLSVLDGWWVKGYRVQVERSPIERLSVGRHNLIYLKLKASRTAVLQLQDDYPPAFSATPARLDVTIPAHQSEELTYRVFPNQRGEYNWGAIHIRQLGLLGLAWHSWQVPQAQAVTVCPDLIGLRSLSIKLTLQNTGSLKRAHRLGLGTEFAELREYSVGDDPRLIDWKATARRSRLLLRVLEPEQEQTLIVLLDSGRLMTSQVQGLARFDWGLNAALALTLAGQHRGDRVGIGVFDRQLHTWLPPERGQNQLIKIIDRLTPLQPTLLEPDYLGAITTVTNQQTRRALVVLITDLIDKTASAELLSALARLTPRYLPFCVTLRDPQVDRQADTLTLDVAGSYAQAVALDLLAQRQVALATLKQKGVLILDAPANQITEQLVDRYLQLKARSQL